MPTTVINHIGKQGDSGRNGTAGVSVSQVRESKIASPHLNLFRANDIDPDISWTRDDQAAFADRYGVNQYVVGDNSLFVLANSNDFRKTAGFTYGWTWEDPTATLDESQTQPDPFGGSLASQFTITGVEGTGFGIYGNILAGQGDILRISVYVKLISGTLNKVQFQNGFPGAAGIEPVDFDIVPDGNWQRITCILSATGSAIGSLLFDTGGAGCVVHLYGANASFGAKLLDYQEVLDVLSLSVANSAPVYRENEKGYLIEGQKTNLCPESQSITRWNATGSPTVGLNPLPDAYGDVNTQTLVTFGANQTITLSQDVTLTDGEEYAVSFFAITNTGEVESLSVSLGGGVAIAVELTSDYTRQSFTLVAGSNDTITFTATSSTGGTSFILHSVQIETGQHSSYIPTGDDPQDRKADIVTMSGAKLPNIANGFTLQTSWRDVDYVDGQNTYLFNTDAGTAAIFQVASGVNRMLFRSNTSSVSVPIDDSNGEMIVTYDGTTTRFYYLGDLLQSTAGLTYTGAAQNAIYLGAETVSRANSLNGYIKTLRMWGFAMTADEVKYISEYDTTNRYEDRG